MLTTLIEPAELAAHLTDADWAVVDCRFDLARPAAGASAPTRAGHIPGALYAHLDRDLSGPHGPRQRAASAARASRRSPRLFGRLGHRCAGAGGRLRPGHRAPTPRGCGGCCAGLGHPAVAVLNGGFAAWQRAGLPVSDRRRGPRAAALQRRTGARRCSFGTPQLEAALAAGELRSGATVLVDARAADRFARRERDARPGGRPRARGAQSSVRRQPRRAGALPAPRRSCASAGRRRCAARRPRPRLRCAARASPPATTCSRSRWPDCRGRGCTPARGASGSATRRTRWRAGAKLRDAPLLTDA